MQSPIKKEEKEGYLYFSKEKHESQNKYLSNKNNYK